MIEVYHGSYTEIKAPDISFGRFNLDFGQGFYVTTLKEQAEKWAKRRSWNLKNCAVVNVYMFDISDLAMKRFEGYSEEWLDFIVQNRQRREPAGDVGYDVIYGNVADDAVARMVNLYMELLIRGRLSVEDKAFFINQLQFSEPNNQYCLATNKSIAKLKFVHSYEME